jgi:hypothetical protein
MEALRSWIAPILIRALDEHLQVTKRKSLHIEDDLSNLYIYCDSIEVVQLVKVRASSEIWTSVRLYLSEWHLVLASFSQPLTLDPANVLPY